MKQLMDYLPAVYGGGLEVPAFEAALEPALAAAWRARDDFLAQINVDTATWGLSAWEEMLALEQNAARGLDTRRARIRAKLRVCGVTTPDLLRNVAAPFSDAPVTVTEHFADSWFTLGITLSLDRPAEDLSALWRQIAEVRPAHLGFLLHASIPPVELQEREQVYLRRLTFCTRIYERGNGIVRLDGAHLLDGSWLLDAGWGNSPHLHCVRIAVHAALREQIGADLHCALTVRNNREYTRAALQFYAHGQERTRARLPAFRMTARVRSTERTGGTLTADSMWRLDGAVALGGRRKLNAEIVRSELG